MLENKSKRLNTLQAGKCPYCGKRISVVRVAAYFIYGTSHVIKCNHCNRHVQPLKQALSFQTSVYIGFLSVIIPMYYMLFTSECDFWYVAINYALPCFLFAELVILFITVYKTKFIKSQNYEK